MKKHEVRIKRATGIAVMTLTNENMAKQYVHVSMHSVNHTNLQEYFNKQYVHVLECTLNKRSLQEYFTQFGLTSYFVLQIQPIPNTYWQVCHYKLPSYL